MFPVFLSLKGRLVVVIGGGAVGRRKAANALAAGARVRFVCLKPRPADENHPDLDWQTAPYTAEHLDGACLVFAAAAPEVNARVVVDAQHRGLWVNAATEPESGDFMVPAVVRRGDFVLAIGTGGAAPALAQTLRRHLEQQFDDAFGHWVSLLGEMRPLVLERIASADQRRILFESWCQPAWLERLRQEGVDAMRTALQAALDEASLPPNQPL
jgi:precorrin-2 dehydrogenase/sirohydrochlorin ferrochelatase